MNFNDLNLNQLLLDAVAEEGYTQPSPIQEGAIPPALDGRDVLGLAQTGTGKTAAFSLPILHRMLEQKTYKKRKIKALVLTPTRELAIQIAESFEKYGGYTHLKFAAIFGGVSAKPQISALRGGLDILVATPGRLNDLLNQHEVDLRYVETFVLDEADRMLDMGFIHDVRKVIQWLPIERQTLFFSATMPPEVEKLAGSLLKDHVTVEVTPVSSTVDSIDQTVYFVDKENKRHLLAHILKHEDYPSVLVFTRTKHGADRVVKDLQRLKIKCAAIHGNKSQGARQTALNGFKFGELRVLVATDIAARGIDIDSLACVVNYDIPNISETYVHRIGRTGRAGLSGRAISFCDISEKEYWVDIELLTKQDVPVVEKHPYPMEVFEVPPKEKKKKLPRNEMGHSEQISKTNGKSGGNSKSSGNKEKSASKNTRSNQRKPVTRTVGNSENRGKATGKSRSGSSSAKKYSGKNTNNSKNSGRSQSQNKNNSKNGSPRY